MRAIITSINEQTTNLCEWALKRNGFDVTLIINAQTTLAEKLSQIYDYIDEDFLRVDADTVVNRNCTPENIIKIVAEDQLKDAWWVQFRTYDWFKQDLTHGGLQFIKREALPALRANIGKFQHINRPETELSRIWEFYNPRRFETSEALMGLNCYKNDIDRVRRVKQGRGQADLYDWELAEKLGEL